MGEGGKHSAKPLGAGNGVELAVSLGQPGRRVEVVVGAQSHDEDVGLVRALIRRHPPRLRVDGRDGLAQETDAGLDDFGIRQADIFGLRLAEHHVELRIAEYERLVRVDQRDARIVSECVGQKGRELETPKPAPKTRMRRCTERA